ncbi:MAG: hypothetical protein HZC54_12980 [Verrucomicrobia bacterium]|nr:hypothetical protein [Verrucomicrobiota bacterium]
MPGSPKPVSGVQPFHRSQMLAVPGLMCDGLLGDDAEDATDASHPSDLGFMRKADAFEPMLRKTLGR